MPRQTGVNIQNKFIRGLVTDSTVLSFPPDACTDANNVVFDSTGRVTRRLGFDTEASYVQDAVTLSAGDAYVTFVWNAVSGNGGISFLVVQQGEVLSFYNLSSSTSISTNKHTTEINLTTSFLAEFSNQDPGIHECQFATGNGDLFVVNSSCEPFYVSYNEEDDEFTATAITLQRRDFDGVDDGLAIDARPSSTVAALATSNPNHLYNLHNQGWIGTDALSQWDTARADLPSNADYIALYRASETDAFQDNIDDQFPGNRPAPKGHFILDVGKANRQEVIEAAGETYVVDNDTFSLIDPSAGTIFTDMDDSTDAFDDETLNKGNFASADSVTSCYIGKNFGSGDTKTVNRAVMYPQTTSGFLFNNNFNLTFTLYGNNSTPSSGTDGTQLGQTVITTDQTDSSVSINSNDPTTAYQYIWVHIAPNSSDDVFIAEVRFFSGTGSFERVSTVEFYAGRVFYGGLKEEGLSSNIYFSQIIEDESQYGRCYQKNDPTSEDFPDLLPDDGGVIKIPELGTLYRLYSYQNALLCFASNGVWIIQGGSGATFKATEYIVRRISNIGMNSPQSLVPIRGLPAWWGEDAIYTVTFDANYDSFTLQPLTDDIIETFYSAIPVANKKYVKGCYDEIEQIAYWLYSDDSSLGTDRYRYDSILCLDTKSKAFYPWDISAGPIVRSVDFIRPADRTDMGVVKYMLHQDYTGTSANQTFGQQLNSNYIDWEEEGTSADYTSYFVTGYQLDGQTQNYFQANYVFVFLEQEANASCYLQSIFDFTTSSATGKWSSQQQIYNENLLLRNTNYRRLKLRGKGRAMQLRFESEAQKPFTIVGWSIWETVNANL